MSRRHQKKENGKQNYYVDAQYKAENIIAPALEHHPN
jgi:hypothetical protein